MEVESTGGSICLTRVASSVRAATGDGTITAWINPPENHSSGAVHLCGCFPAFFRFRGHRRLSARNLAANIEAIVESGGEKRMKPIQHSLFVSATPVRRGKRLARAQRRRRPAQTQTSAGQIKLQFLDSETGLRDSLIRETVTRCRSGRYHSRGPANLRRCRVRTRIGVKLD